MYSSVQIPNPPAHLSSLAKMARMANLVCAGLLSAGILLQIFFAGLGALASSSYWPVHRTYGYTLMWLAFAMPLFGIAGRVPRRVHALNALGVVLIILQFSFIWLPFALGLPGEVRALHAVNAVALFSIDALNAMILWRTFRTASVETPAQHVLATTEGSTDKPAPASTVLIVGASLAMILTACLCAGIGMLSMSAIVINTEAVSNAPAKRAVSDAQANSIEGGQATFQQQCSMCHSSGTDVKYGPGLAGLFEPGGPALPGGVDYAGKLPNDTEINEANVAAWIRSGGRGQIGQMPPRNLNDDAMAGLIAYLRTLQKTQR